MICKEEYGHITASKSGTVIRFVGGGHGEAYNKAAIEVANGLLKGTKLHMDLLGKKGSGTTPLYPTNNMSHNRLIIECEEHLDV